MGRDLRQQGKVYLERALSKLGIASRSTTKAMIAAGRLSVNGRVVKDPNHLVSPETDVVRLDGKLLKPAAAATILLHKPKGYVTTASDEKGRKTVYDLLPKELRHLHPVGRLDMHSSGLLLMTTDTKLSSYLTDPAHAIEREYVVTVKGRLDAAQISRLKAGIEDKGELLRAKEIVLRKVSGRESHVLVVLSQGKNREIRRMFGAIGHEVTALKRIRFGQYKLGPLETGKYFCI